MKDLPKVYFDLFQKHIQNSLLSTIEHACKHLKEWCHIIQAFSQVLSMCHLSPVRKVSYDKFSESLVESFDYNVF